MSESNIIQMLRYALVGRINIHHTVVKLEPNETVEDAIKRVNDMVHSHDIELERTTRTTQFHWAEDDNCRIRTRANVCEEIINFFIKLAADGSFHTPHPLFTEEQILDMIDKATLKREAGDKPR